MPPDPPRPPRGSLKNRYTDETQKIVANHTLTTISDSLSGKYKARLLSMLCVVTGYTPTKTFRGDNTTLAHWLKKWSEMWDARKQDHRQRVFLLHV